MNSTSRLCRVASSALAATLLVVTVLLQVSAAAATGPGFGAVSVIIDGDAGRPVAGAAMALRSATSVVRGVSDARGTITLALVATGTYVVEVAAAGYARLSGRTLEVRTGEATTLTIQLVRAGSSLVTLGRVITRAGEALSTASAPSEDLSAQSAAAQGVSDVAELLDAQAYSATVIRTSGGSPALPVVVALRGPDPTETLVDIDGEPINSGDSGAFDLSLLDPASLSDVQLVYGIAPSSLVGPNTIDGAINIRTLDPTSTSQGLLRISGGSFGSFGATLQATGTDDAIGYALSLHRTTTKGEVDQTVATSDDSSATVGSAIDGSTGLAKVRYDFDLGRGFAEFTLRDQSEFRDLSAGLTSLDPTTGFYDSFDGSSELAHDTGYGLDVDLPVEPVDRAGTIPESLVFRHLTSVADQSIFGPATGTTPYLNDDRDVQADDSLELDRPLDDGSLEFKIDFRSEALDTEEPTTGTVDQSIFRRTLGVEGGGAPGGQLLPLSGLTQEQRSAVAAYTDDPTSHLHYSSAVYFSDFSSFGSSIDPRFGLVWTPTAASALRASVGSTFQAPQLPELYVPPVLPPPDSSGFIDIGNPDLRADRATDYDIGSTHLFGGADDANASIDLYRTDLRAPSQRYFPAADCGASPPPPPAACESFPINIGDGVYQGVEVRAGASMGAGTTLHLSYTVNSSYASVVAPQFQDGTIVVGEQSLGVPLHSAKASIVHDAGRGFAYDADVEYEDSYDELFRPAFATLDAGVTWHGSALDVGLYGTNLTDVYDDRFTLSGAGIPYGGIDGPIPTDAYALQGTAFTLTLTRHY
jgi:outer membrane receptor protein involved in Fe transport